MESQSLKGKVPSEGNRRSNYRHAFMGAPLCGTMSIISVGEKNIASNSAYICIRDIGSGGIRFESHLNIPVREDLVISIETAILGQQLHLMGIVKRMKPLDNKQFEYGFQFIVNETESIQIGKLVNNLSVKMQKQMDRITGCNMCSSRTVCHINQAKLAKASGAE